MKLYKDVAALGVLTDKHREELRKKRGFTDATIDACGFFSAGPQLKTAIESLVKEYGVEVMVSAGLYTAKTSPPQVASQWTGDGIVIPYRNGEDVVYLRTHKYGPSGVPVQLYLPSGNVPAGKVVIAESEFKAAAAHQLGFPAIGLPGIWSFTKNKWSELQTACKNAGVEEVVICFDNENKADPTSDRFKPDPMKRYDAEFCGYLLGSLFKKGGITARIATLPDTWREGGKADIDGAVAQGKGRADFEAVFAAALDPETYLENLPDEARYVVRQKVAAFNTKSRLYADHNCYWWRRTDRDGGEKHAKCSNFVLEILATFDDPDGCNRLIKFVDEHGKPSRPALVSPAEMASVPKFKEWCIKQGNYLWFGSDKALQALWEMLFREHGDRVIYRPNHVGWVEHGDLWLFENGALTKDGTLLKPDEDGVIYHPVSNQGYRAMPPSGDARRVPAKGDRQPRMPRLHLGDGPTIQYISDMLCENFGTWAPAIGVGWVIGTVYSADLFPLYDSFPFLFLFGKRRGGKSTLARYLCAMCGLETEGDSIAETTQVGIARSMSYYSSLPYWLEEFRNEKEILRKGSYLRAAYNRAGAAKGLKAEFGTRQVDCRSTLLLCGEDTPSDPALLSRCVIVSINEKDRKGTRYRELQDTWTSFGACFRPLIEQRAARIEGLIAKVREVREFLVKQKINDRTACNWSIPVACYLSVVDENKDFARWAVEQARIAHLTTEDETSVNQFLEDLAVMHRSGQITDSDLRIDSDRLYIRMADCYLKWAEAARRRGIDPMKRSTIEHSFRDIPGYEGRRVVRMGNAGRTARCHAFRLDVDDLPQCIADLAGMELDGEEVAA